MMHTASWSDDDFRSFMTALRDSGFPSLELSEASRDAFLREARARLAPRVQRQLLADIGVTASPAGVAIVAFEILERETWGKRHTWLLATTDPWGVLAELAARKIGAAYRSTVKASADRKKLEGIAEASSRAAIEPGAPTGEVDADDDSPPSGGHPPSERAPAEDDTAAA